MCFFPKYRKTNRHSLKIVLLEKKVPHVAPKADKRLLFATTRKD